MMRSIKYASPPIFIAAVIFYLCCLATSDDMPSISWPYTDKVVHFLMYLGLSVVASFWYIYGEKGLVNVRKLIIYAFILPILYGGLIEILQHRYFEGRSGDWFDFLADVLGSLAALPLALYFRRILINRESQ